MTWNGSGTYRKWNYATNGWTGDASLSIGIEAGRHDSQDDDFVSGINNCLAKDGQNTPTSNLPMAGFRHTGCGSAVADTDYTTLGQIKGGVPLQTTNTTSTYSIENYNNTASGSRLHFIKSRGSTIGSNVIVQNGDSLGAMFFYGGSGTSYPAAAAIVAEVDGVPGATNDMPGRLAFYTSQDGTASLLEKMRITNAGYVGISTAAPSDTLHVKGAIRLDVNYTPTWDTGGRLWLEAGFGNRYDGYAHRFDVGNTRTEAMRISANGQVSIGTTATGATLNVQNFLNNTSSPISAGSNVAGDVGTAAITISKKDNNSTTSQSFIQFLINGAATGSGQINANGALQAAFGSYSDSRLKENIVDLPGQLDKILALRPVEFDYKDGSGHQIGFIAQEVQEQYPDLVAEGKDEYLMLSGLGKNEARLIKAIQELAARVEALENAASSR